MSKNSFSSREVQMAGKDIKRKKLVSFAVFIALLSVGYFAWYKLYNQPQGEGKIQPALRSVLVTNERLFSKFYSANRKAKSYSKSDATANVRVNGNVGMGDNFDAAAWRLKVARKPGDTLTLSLDDLKALPKTEVVFDFKCVEGWNQVTYWGGVRVSDFLRKYNLAPQMAMGYVGMVTPDSAYYVGVDMPSMLQPQTLLCYEMNGKPLPKNQGAPLRLIIPVKYGIKHLKRVGTIFFSNTKPRDYWAELGYDYYAGL